MADPQVILNADIRFDESKLQQSFNRLEQRLKLSGPFNTLSKDTASFSYQLDRATQRVITLGTAFSILSTSTRILRDIATSTLAVEKSMINLNAIFKLTTESVKSLQSNLFNTARETASSFENTAKAAEEFARQGLSVAKTQEAVRAALILSRDANIDVTDSVRALTAATNSFSKEALGYLQIANRIATVDTAFAVSSKDLQEALIRTGSAAADAGVSFNQFIGLVTAAQQISQRGGTVIAGALNTIFTRVQRKDTLDALEGLGVAITDVQGRTLPMINILTNFAKAYDGMTGSIKNQAAELVGGVRQLNTLKATLSDLSKANSVFAQTQELVANSTNQAEQRNAARNQSLSAQLQQLALTSKQIGANVGQVGFNNNGTFKGIISGLNNNPITDALRDADKAETAGGTVAQFFLKGFGGAVTFGLTPIIGALLVNLGKKVFSNVFSDIRATATLDTAAQKQLSIESEIVALYKAGGAALQQQLATMTSLTERAALLDRLLLSAQGNQFSSVGSLAAEVGRIRGTRRAAGGYVPMAEESAAISAGVGGAPLGARPVFLPNFNLGGGNRGIVANTSEFVVPHMAGGSAIYNREMIQKFGLPPGATPVAAGGFVPNAAGGGLFGYESLRPEPGSGGAFYIPKVQTDSLNQLFVNLSKAGSAAEASKFANQILDLSKSFDVASRSNVAQNLSTGLKKFYQFGTLSSSIAGGTLAASQYSNIVKPSYPGRQVATYAELVAMNRTIDPYSDLGVLKGTGVAGSFAANRAIAPYANVFAANQALGSGANTFAANRSLAGYSLPFDPFLIPPVVGTGRSPVGLQTRTAPAVATAPYVLPSAGNIPLDPNLVNDPWNPYLAAPGLRARQRTLRNQSLASSVDSPSGFSQFANKYGGLKSSLALGIGLPFFGSNISEGVGGTTEGKLRGAASNALNIGGLGATAGSLFGPEGTLIGAGLGLAIGGLVGAISKSTKSFEEMAVEIDQRNKKLNEELTHAVEAVNLNEQYKESLSNGNAEQAIELRKQIGDNISQVSNPEYLKILSGGLNDPDAAAKLVKAGNKITGPLNLRDSLQTSLMAGKTFLNNQTPDQLDSAKMAVYNIIKNKSTKELLSLSRANEEDPFASVQSVGRAAGIRDQDELDQLASPGRGSLDFAQEAIRKAIRRVINRPKVNTRPAEEGVFRARGLRDLAAQYQSSADYTGLVFGADRQIEQVRQQIASQNPALSDIQQLRQSGSFSTQNIAAQFSGAREVEMLAGRGRLSEVMANLNVSEATKDKVGNLGSVSQFRAFSALLDTEKGRAAYRDLGPESGPFSKALKDFIIKMDDLTGAEEQNTRASEQGNRLLQEQLLRSKTFKGATEEYSGAAEKAITAYTDAYKRGDTPDRIFALNSAQRSASLNLAYQQSTQSGSIMSSGSFYGQQLEGRNKDTFLARRNDADAIRSLLQSGSPTLSGSQVSSGLFGGAVNQGRQGNSMSSLAEGFRSVFAGIKQDILDLSDLGQSVAQNLNSSLGNAFGEFVTGAKKGKDAFRDFTVSILSDTSRMLASKAISGLLSFIPGFTGAANGGPIGLAAGGMVPAMLTGGEVYIGPSAAKKIGYGTLKQINGYAGGGDVRMVRGGSGVRDDVPANLPSGSFIVRKSVAQQLGPDYFRALAGGQVQHRDLGGILLGALLGGGAGYAFGGKKGAIGGALLGGIGGGLYGMNHGAVTSASGNINTFGTGTTLSIGQKALLGLGVSGGLGLLAAGVAGGGGGSSAIGLNEVPTYRANLESWQNSQIAKGGAFPYLSVGPQGQSYIQGFGDSPATRRWADGGGVDIPMTNSTRSDTPNVHVKIDINNNGTVTSSTSADGKGAFGTDFAEKMDRQVRGIVQEELVNATRSDGFLTQRSRYNQRF